MAPHMNLASKQLQAWGVSKGAANYSQSEYQHLDLPDLPLAEGVARLLEDDDEFSVRIGACLISHSEFALEDMPELS